jgi:hypothetical protein
MPVPQHKIGSRRASGTGRRRAACRRVDERGRARLGVGRLAHAQAQRHPLRIPFHQTVIYEAHVKGMTAAHPRLAGVVAARREGRHTFYTIEDPHVLTLIEQIFSHTAFTGRGGVAERRDGVRARRSRARPGRRRP